MVSRPRPREEQLRVRPWHHRAAGEEPVESARSAPSLVRRIALTQGTRLLRSALADSGLGAPSARTTTRSSSASSPPASNAAGSASSRSTAVALRLTTFGRPATPPVEGRRRPRHG
ncbi:MAG: hypothetical protein R3B70_47755 [Polyangiaceae bacterium]